MIRPTALTGQNLESATVDATPRIRHCT